MKRDLVSIIIPIYNVESFLDHCLNSISKQSYQHIEVLLIDDGSTDGSSAICEKHMELDPRFKYYFQNNSGVSSARNKGIKYANGKYLCFIDSDDYVSENYIENLVDAIIKTDSDLVFSGWSLVNNSEVLSTVEFNKMTLTLTDYYLALSQQNLILRGGAVSKLYKTDILHECDICFDVNMSYAEDLNFLLKYMLKTRSVRFVSDVDYYYRVGRVGTLSRKINAFDQECYCLREIQKRYVELIDFMNLVKHRKELTILYASLWFYILRLINSIYLIAGTKYLQRRDKIMNALSIISIEKVSVISKYYLPYCLHDKIQFNLMKNGLILLFDIYTRFIYSTLKKVKL